MRKTRGFPDTKKLPIKRSFAILNDDLVIIIIVVVCAIIIL